jgi:hypothetical protein
MTKVTIIGGEPTEKKIEFKLVLFSDLSMNESTAISKAFKNIELICLNYRNGDLDLMFGYDDNRSEGYLYLGHFNDGIV